MFEDEEFVQKELREKKGIFFNMSVTPCCKDKILEHKPKIKIVQAKVDESSSSCNTLSPSALDSESVNITDFALDGSSRRTNYVNFKSHSQDLGDINKRKFQNIKAKSFSVRHFGELNINTDEHFRMKAMGDFIE